PRRRGHHHRRRPRRPVHRPRPERHDHQRRRRLLARHHHRLGASPCRLPRPLQAGPPRMTRKQATATRKRRKATMKLSMRLSLAGVALAAATSGAMAAESQFGPADAKEIYYWVSNKANLPLFVQYDYVGMKKVAEELGVQVRVAG